MATSITTRETKTYIPSAWAERAYDDYCAYVARKAQSDLALPEPDPARRFWWLFVWDVAHVRTQNDHTAVMAWGMAATADFPILTVAERPEPEDEPEA